MIMVLRQGKQRCDEPDDQLAAVATLLAQPGECHAPAYEMKVTSVNSAYFEERRAGSALAASPENIRESELA